MEKRVKQLNITAEEMDRRQSAARRLNRNESNRLRQQQEHIRDNHEVVAIEIDQEMRKIQNELNEIREITGHDSYASSPREGNSHKFSSKRKRKQKTARQRKPKPIEIKLRRKFTRDETLVDSKVKFNSDEDSLLISSRSTAGDNLPRNVELHTAHMSEPASKMAARVSRFSRHKKDEKLPNIAANLTSDSRSLLELDVDEARVQARKRLLGENNVNDNEESGQPGTNDENDIEPYMYVPPDGRKRTVYLIPPLEDLLKEARKARYLRMPKRWLNDEDDPEREISIDEIFNK